MISTRAQQILTPLLEKCDEVSSLFRSLAHPVRLKILCQVMETEKAVNELTDFCEISQSSMSQFLTRMKDEGILALRKHGRFAYYRIKDPSAKKLIKALCNIYRT